MKKSILALILVLCMTLLLVGCQSGEATPDEVTVSETAVAETTAPQYVTFTLDAFSFNGFEHQFSLQEDLGGEEKEVFFNNITFTAQPGDVIETVLSENNYSKIKNVELQDEFLGWMEYKQVTIVDENDVETVTYERTSDALYSNKELMQKSVPEYNVKYLARWKDIGDDYYSAYGY
ncbi:MAG: hypothetical protein E7513_04665 [Ruminococcaceae bacterium]|nr:hypothetical protein [Oscillospiraceae bacterium]